MKTVYIGGPMTGKPLYNYPAFDEAANRWFAEGWHVLTPADITRDLWLERHGTEFDPAIHRMEYGDPLLCEAFKRDLAAVCDADAIALLEGWEHSKGANVELSVARLLGKAVLCAHSMVPLLPFHPAAAAGSDPLAQKGQTG